METVDDLIKKRNTVIDLTKEDALALKVQKGVLSISVIVFLPFWQNNRVEVIVTKEIQRNGPIYKIPGGGVKDTDKDFFETGQREVDEELKAKVSIDSLEYFYGWEAKNTSEASQERHYKLCLIAKEFILSQDFAEKDEITDTDIKNRFFVPFMDLEKIEWDPEAKDWRGIPYTQRHALPFAAEALTLINPKYTWDLLPYLQKLPQRPL